MKTAGRLAILVLAVAGLSVESAFARGGGGGRGSGGAGGGRAGTSGYNNGNNGTNYGNTNPTSKPSAASNDPAIIAARKKLTEAQGTTDKAEANLNTIAINLKSAFDMSPEYAAAMAAQTQAQADYDTAVAAAKTKLSENGGYQDALNRKQKAEKEIDAMHQRGEAPEDVLKVTQQALAAGAEAHRLESQATAADPKVAEVKAKLVDAAAKVSNLRKDFEKSVHQNAVWQTAKTALDTARADQQKAQVALTQLLNGGIPAKADADEKAAAN